MFLKKRIHFDVFERKILLCIFDVLFVLGGLKLVCYTLPFSCFSVLSNNWSWVVMLIIYLISFGLVFELYNIQKLRHLESVFKAIILTVFVAILCYFLTPVISIFPTKKIEVLYLYLTIVSSIFLCRLLYIVFIESPRFYKKAIIIGEPENIKSIIEALKASDPNYRIVGFVKSGESQDANPVVLNEIKTYNIKNLIEAVKTESVSEIIIAIQDANSITVDLYSKLTKLLGKGFVIKEYTQVFEEIAKRIPVQFMDKDFYSYFPFSNSNKNKLYVRYYRLMDITVALIGLLFGGIIFPLIIVGNLLANRGNLFYVQDRVGKDGKLFTIIKYRTMIENAETNGAKWAEENDARVTNFGRFLRKSRLDEIPQFINVLKGDMSIIGPRPERAFFVKELSQRIPFYETRHTIKPGLSGWAQVNTEYGASVEDSLKKLQYDLYYIKHRNFFLDLNIIIKTISTIVFYRGR